MQELAILCNDPECPCEDTCCQACEKIDTCEFHCDAINYVKNIYTGNENLIKALNNMADEKDSWLIAVSAQRIEYLAAELEQLRKDLDVERRINALFGEWIDAEEMDLIDVCPEWCTCCEENPCSFQLEWSARKQIQTPQEVHEWLKGVNCPDCKVKGACNPLDGQCPCEKAGDADGN